MNAIKAEASSTTLLTLLPSGFNTSVFNQLVREIFSRRTNIFEIVLNFSENPVPVPQPNPITVSFDHDLLARGQSELFPENRRDHNPSVVPHGGMEYVAHHVTHFSLAHTYRYTTDWPTVSRKWSSAGERKVCEIIAELAD
jgi:hypothetical protein